MKKISRRTNPKNSATKKSTKPSRTETAEEARALDIGRLREAGKKDPAAQELADRIEACSTKRRCGSGACPRCMTVTQSGVARSLRRLAKAGTEAQKIAVVTIAPVNSATTLGQLPTFDNDNFRRRLKYALRNAQINWGGVRNGFFIQ